MNNATRRQQAPRSPAEQPRNRLICVGLHPPQGFSLSDLPMALPSRGVTAFLAPWLKKQMA
ncbi:MAG: hypothetical protein EBT62_02405 [Opitutaceae bacterium]|nr:hypothetical protein [Opitutaceae bacterium]